MLGRGNSIWLIVAKFFLIVVGWGLAHKGVIGAISSGFPIQHLLQFIFGKTMPINVETLLLGAECNVLEIT